MPLTTLTTTLLIGQRLAGECTVDFRLLRSRLLTQKPLTVFQPTVDQKTTTVNQHSTLIKNTTRLKTCATSKYLGFDWYELVTARGKLGGKQRLPLRPVRAIALLAWRTCAKSDTAENAEDRQNHQHL